MLVINGAGLLVAGAVWFIRSWQGKPAPIKPAPGFGGLLQGILQLIDALDDEDSVKTELGKDLFALLQEYLAPAPAPAVSQSSLTQALLAALKQSRSSPPTPPPPPAPAPVG